MTTLPERVAEHGVQLREHERRLNVHDRKLDGLSRWAAKVAGAIAVLAFAGSLLGGIVVAYWFGG